jgi:hypothetical protein
MKTFLEFMREDFSPDMQNFLKNNEMNRKMKAREPAEPSKFAPLDPNWQEKMNNKFNAIINSKPVDFSGSRYGDEGIVSDQDKVTRQNQKQLRKDYQQPPGYDTPAFNRAKERMAAADARDGEPPMPGAGPYKTRQADPLNTPPSVPVEPTKPPIPKAKPKQITSRIKPIQDKVSQEKSGLKGMQADNPDVSGSLLRGFRYEPETQRTSQQIPKPKLRPERKPAITNTDNTKGAVAIPKPDSVGINVKPSKKAPETFKQIFARTPEGQKFTWTDPKTGKTGTYLRKTKKG